MTARTSRWDAIIVGDIPVIGEYFKLRLKHVVGVVLALAICIIYSAYHRRKRRMKLNVMIREMDKTTRVHCGEDAPMMDWWQEMPTKSRVQVARSIDLIWGEGNESGVTKADERAKKPWSWQTFAHGNILDVISKKAKNGGGNVQALKTFDEFVETSRHDWAQYNYAR